MKHLKTRNLLALVLSLLCAFALSACASTSHLSQDKPPEPVEKMPMPGSDRDAHGCIGSAGYAWCEREKVCVRPWELAGEKGFAPGIEAFDKYCGNNGNK